MNALTGTDLNDELTWQLATAKLHCWRGECIELFAQIESHVSEALELVHRQHPKTDLPHLVGARFETLAEFLRTNAQNGHFRFAANVVARAVSHHDLRTTLCHDTSSVTLGRCGGWMVRLKVTRFRNGKAERLSRSFDETEADAARRDLECLARELKAALGQVRVGLTRPTNKAA